MLADVREIDGCTEHEFIIWSATVAILCRRVDVGQCGQHGLDVSRFSAYLKNSNYRTSRRVKYNHEPVTLDNKSL